jgi:C4-dicarboxylate transporter DctM subunit
VETWIIFIGLFVLLLWGIPIVFVLGLLAAGVLLVGGVSLSAIISTMFGGMENFVFLAIPFFVLAGQLMNATGLTKNLLDFANLLVGRMRGGLAMVNVVASMFFAGITGAATSDSAALGAILIPAMEEDGYTTDTVVLLQLAPQL